MASTFYDPGDQRSAKVNALFRRIARRYDLINDLQSVGLHRFWKRRVVELAALQPGQRVLDLCCGTGDIALAIAQPKTEVVGLDFTSEMLNVAERRARATAKVADQRIQFVCADAQKIPFADDTFDAVTVGYGLRNLADWKLGLIEMQRVAKPRGRLLVLEFGKPANPCWRAVYLAYLRLFVPLFGLIFCGNAGAYSYILESLKHYPSQNEVAATLRNLGLENVKIHNLLGGAMSIHYAQKPG